MPLLSDRLRSHVGAVVALCLAIGVAGVARAQLAPEKAKAYPAGDLDMAYPAGDLDIAALLAAIKPNPAPDLFGFSALSLGDTIYDDIWKEAAGQPWPSGRPDLDAFVADIQSLPVRERVQQANAWVNARVRFGNDPNLIDPHWASLGQTLSRGGGEREDIAIAKMQLLAAAGLPRDDLYLVLASDVRRLKPDALLVVRDGDRVYALSSRQDALVDDQQVGLYVPIIALGYDGKWIFGRRASGSSVADRTGENASGSRVGLDVGRAAYQSLLSPARSR